MISLMRIYENESLSSNCVRSQICRWYLGLLGRCIRSFGILPTKANKPINPPNWAFLAVGDWHYGRVASSEANLMKDFGGTSTVEPIRSKISLAAST